MYFKTIPTKAARIHSSKAAAILCGSPSPRSLGPSGFPGHLLSRVWLQRKADQDLAKLGLEPHNTGSRVTLNTSASKYSLPSTASWLFTGDKGCTVMVEGLCDQWYQRSECTAIEVKTKTTGRRHSMQLQ